MCSELDRLRLGNLDDKEGGGVGPRCCVQDGIPAAAAEAREVGALSPHPHARHCLERRLRRRCRAHVQAEESHSVVLASCADGPRLPIRSVTGKRRGARDATHGVKHGPAAVRPEIGMER
jgi:hypothetical protein